MKNTSNVKTARKNIKKEPQTANSGRGNGKKKNPEVWAFDFEIDKKITYRNLYILGLIACLVIGVICGKAIF